MPQTSPINWTILSLSMVLSILCIFSNMNEKTNQNAITHMKFNLIMKPWNW